MLTSNDFNEITRNVVSVLKTSTLLALVAFVIMGIAGHFDLVKSFINPLVKNAAASNTIRLTNIFGSGLAMILLILIGQVVSITLEKNQHFSKSGSFLVMILAPLTFMTLLGLLGSTVIMFSFLMNLNILLSRKINIHYLSIPTLLLFFLFYITPSLIAFYRKHHQKLAIALLNVFTGWTILGWFASIVWSGTAVINNKEQISSR